MKLGPLTQGLRQLLSNKVLRLLSLGWLADRDRHPHQLLQAGVEVNVRGHRNVKQTLGLTEVQVGPVALASRIQDPLVVRCRTVKHRINTCAVAR